MFQLSDLNAKRRCALHRLNVAIKNLLLMSSLALLTGCGFHLRGTAETLPATFPSLNIECEKKSAWRLCHYLNSRITSAGTVIDPNSSITLSVRRSETQNRVFSLENDASAAERELKHSIRYTLLDKTSGEVLSERTISRSQIYRHNASALIAKDREKEELQKSLDEALIDIMLREISILSRE